MGLEHYTVVGVRFKKAGKIYYFDPNEAEVEEGDDVIVETARGLEYGHVVISPKTVTEAEIVAPLKKVTRKATEQDYQQMTENIEEEQEAYEVCLKKIDEHQLEMKLVDVEQNFDKSKIIFYFTADGRVDFRDLVKDLAAVFKTRIELRQIGVRDEAKLLGGIGPCGRTLCCSTFLGDFEPVSIKMAKEQNLSLNPNKISGICGRLMCCLRYESCVYQEAQAKFPGVDTEVSTQEGPAKVVDYNIVKETVQIELEDTLQVKEIPLEEITWEEKNDCGCDNNCHHHKDH